MVLINHQILIINVQENVWKSEQRIYISSLELIGLQVKTLFQYRT